MADLGRRNCGQASNTAFAKPQLRERAGAAAAGRRVATNQQHEIGQSLTQTLHRR